MNVSRSIISISKHHVLNLEQSKDMTGSYNAFATENKGIFRMGSVDCTTQVDIDSKYVSTIPYMYYLTQFYSFTDSLFF